MSYGLPCLASDIRPHREVIIDGENGFLFSTNHTQEFRNILSKLIFLPENARKEVGERARVMVREEYDWNSVADQVQKVYEEVATGNAKT